MKTITIITLLLLSLTVKAQEEQTMKFELPSMMTYSIDQREREIEYDKLPAKIQVALEENKDYAGWSVQKVFLVEFPTFPTSTYYKIELINGTKTKIVKLDADGQQAS